MSPSKLNGGEVSPLAPASSPEVVPEPGRRAAGSSATPLSGAVPRNAQLQALRLGDHCTKLGSGATPKGGKESYKGGDTALIRSQNVLNERFSENGIVYIDSDQARGLANVQVEADDVLLNITGDSVARCCQAPRSIIPARVNQHVMIIRTNDKVICQRFLRYYLVSPDIQQSLLALASSGATRNALTKGMIENFNVCAPGITHQKSIAHILGTLDDKIELNRRINQTLEEMAQALFKSWFVDFDPVRAKAAVYAAANSDPTDPTDPTVGIGHARSLRLGEQAELAAMRVISGKTDDELDAMRESQPDAYAELARTAFLFPSRLTGSDLGQIPEGWTVSGFGSVSECFDNKRIPLSKSEREKRQGTIPYYGATSQMGLVDKPIFQGCYLLLGEDGSVVREDGTPFTQYVWGNFWVNNHAHVLQGKGAVTTEHLLTFIRGQNIDPSPSGRTWLSSHLCFKLDGAASTERGVSSGGVVPSVDPI